MFKLNKTNSESSIINFEHIQQINTLFNVDMCRNYTE